MNPHRYFASENGPSQLKKVKKANGEIIGVNVVRVITMWTLAAVQVAGGMG